MLEGVHAPAVTEAAGGIGVLHDSRPIGIGTGMKLNATESGAVRHLAKGTP